MKTRDPQFTRRLGGVYAIICTVNGRQYIGNTTTTFHRRWVDHRSKLNTGAHPNKGLQADWVLYGRDCFEFHPIDIKGVHSYSESAYTG